MKRMLLLFVLCLTLVLAGCGQGQDDNPANKPEFVDDGVRPERDPNVDYTVDTSSPAYSMRLESQSGLEVSFAHTRDQATQILMGSVFTVEFTEEGVDREQYDWEAEGILVDYLDQKIVALRIEDIEQYDFEETWEAVLPLAGGELRAKLGDSQMDLMKAYDPTEYHQWQSSVDGSDVGFTAAYDMNFKPQKYSENAPYQVHFRCRDGKLNYIILQDNHSY